MLRDFVQTNFAELLLSVIILIIAIVLCFCIHLHADEVAKWCMATITAVIMGLLTLLNSIKQPKPNGTTTVSETHVDPIKETK